MGILIGVASILERNPSLAHCHWGLLFGSSLRVLEGIRSKCKTLPDI